MEGFLSHCGCDGFYAVNVDIFRLLIVMEIIGGKNEEIMYTFIWPAVEHNYVHTIQCVPPFYMSGVTDQQTTCLLQQQVTHSIDIASGSLPPTITSLGASGLIYVCNPLGAIFRALARLNDTHIDKSRVIPIVSLYPLASNRHIPGEFCSPVSATPGVLCKGVQPGVQVLLTICKFVVRHRLNRPFTDEYRKLAISCRCLGV